MDAFGLGPMPGYSMSEAADIVMGETGGLPHLPQLPDRGIYAGAIGRTAGLLEAVSIDRGPRSWVLSDRPQLISHRIVDQMSRDLDETQEVWGESVPLVKVQAVGPWSLAAAVELGNGHRAITDSGAFRDLCGALLAGIQEHKAQVAQRFGAEVLVQLDEPLLADVLSGTLPGTTDFDTIRAVPADQVNATLAEFGADYLRLREPLWEVAAKTVLLDFAGLASPAHLDGLGQWIDGGARVGLGVAGHDARTEAISIAQHFDRMGLSRERIPEQVDIFPWPVEKASDSYSFAAEVAGILIRDAGDL